MDYDMKPITERLFANNKNKFYPVITAHSGCEGTPDNSIEHIKTAITSGAEMLEIDINRHDGILYLTHNPKEDYSGCPTFEQCLALVAPTEMCINCDVKTFGLTADVMALAAGYQMESRIVFTGSVADDELSALNETKGDWWLSLWHSDHEPEDLADACAKYRQMEDLYRIINLDHGMVNDDVCRTAHEAGYHLSVWTVNKEEMIRRMMEYGVWNITTRKPLLALKIRRELFGV